MVLNSIGEEFIFVYLIIEGKVRIRIGKVLVGNIIFGLYIEYRNGVILIEVLKGEVVLVVNNRFIVVM